MNAAPHNNELITGLHKGEETAIRKLYSLYYRALCYFAEKILHNKEEAEDIAVESFLKMLDKKDDFTHQFEIRSFLFTVARNACIDQLRKNKVRYMAGRDLESLVEPDQLLADQEMIAAKVLQVIYAEVEKLPGQCRQVFKAVFLEGKITSAFNGTNSDENEWLHQMQSISYPFYKGKNYHPLTIISQEVGHYEAYEGDWVGNDMEGNGVYFYFANNFLYERYEGNFSDNNPEGQGKKFSYNLLGFTTKTYYEGGFSKGNRAGYGTETGEIFINKKWLDKPSREGIWKDNQFVEETLGGQ